MRLPRDSEIYGDDREQDMKAEAESILYKTRTVCGGTQNIGIYAVAAIVNDLAAQGAVIPNGCSMSVQLLLPLDFPKFRMYEIKREIKNVCLERGLELLEISEERHAALSECIVSATGVFHTVKADVRQEKKLRAGQQVVLTKWAGLEGTVRIMDRKQKELRQRFAPAFLNQIESLRPEIFALKEIVSARDEGVSAIRQIGGGGILAALWRLAGETGKGLDIDLKRISVRQETIEVCEYFRLNPYQLASAGSMLMVANDGEALAGSLRRSRIEASVIGSLTDNHDKIIRNGEEVRYIDRPAPDELNKIFMEDNHAGQ